MRLWNTETGELLVTLVAGLEGEWLAITPEGFFNASDRGADILSVVRGLEVFSFDQFYQALYRPDLVREKLAGDPRNLVREAAARIDLGKVLASGNAPMVTLASPRDGDRSATDQVRAEVEIAPRDGGVGRVEWRVNNVTVALDEAPSAGRLSRSLPLDFGENIIEVTAYNGPNLVASRPARALVEGPSAASSSARARLFVLTVGVNEYASESLKLRYAVPDAEALGAALGKAGEGFYESVRIEAIKDRDVQIATLGETFARLTAEIRPQDVFVFFIAGHGKTVDGRYYFIPQPYIPHDTAAIPAGISTDERRGQAEALLKRAVAAQGIGQDQWQRWFSSIRAKRSIMLFDTCESGTVVDDEHETQLLERAAASSRMVQATGRTILAASSGDTEALEGFKDHGLFTYNVLEAIGNADSDGNGTVEISELAAYVHAQVTILSERVFKRRQEPQIRITGNYAFAKTVAIVSPPVAAGIAERSTHFVATEADLLVLPTLGARRVRKLAPRTAVNLVSSEAGWSLIARNGRPIGYVATRQLLETK